ncbi:MAG: HIT domain-containing protein [Chloroflexota bacterium]
MRPLWAPWRSEYIQQGEPQGCFLCLTAQEDKDEANLILLRGHENFVLLNSYPYNPGHLLVAPYRHGVELEELTSEELAEHFQIVAKMVWLLRSVFSPQGFNIGLNIDRCAGAGVTDHLHTHIVPRWSGDTNFMPVLGQTKVISQALHDSYRQLKEGLKNLS